MSCLDPCPIVKYKYALKVTQKLPGASNKTPPKIKYPKLNFQAIKISRKHKMI